MWYEHTVVKVFLAGLTFACVMAVLFGAVTVAGWILRAIFFAVRWLSTPVICWMCGKHDYQLVSCESEYDYKRVEYKCRFCRGEYVDRK